MAVSAKVERLLEGIVSFEVEVPKERVMKGFDLAYSKIGKNVRVPGFRKGNIPRGILRKRYEFSLKKEALESIVEASIKEVTQKEDIHLISELEVQDLSSAFDSISEEEGFSFKVRAEAYPEVVIGEYKGIKLGVPKYIFTDEHVDDKLSEMQYKASDFVDRGDDSVVGDGDLIVLSLHFLGSLRIEDTYREYYLNMKDVDTPFDGIRDKLLGMKKGEEKELELAELKSVSEELYSKYKTLSLKVEEIKSQDIPDIDDELAKDYSFDNLEVLKEDIRNNLEKNCEQRKKDVSFDKLVAKIIESSRFSIGKQAVDFQIYTYIQKLEEKLKENKMSIEDYANSLNQNIEQLKGSYEEKAIQDIKFELIKGAIIKQEEIKISEEDIEANYKEYASYANISYDEAKNILNSKDSGAMVNSVLLYKKFVSFLFDNNTVEEEDDETLIYDILKKDKSIS